ncbi:MAG: chromophore lyase CpcT/CpeT [Microcoleaceae cyanobacterium]
MMNRRLIVISTFSTILTIGCGVKNGSIQHQTEEVAGYLEGIMDTTEQAAAISDAASVRMTTCEIEVEEIETTNQQTQFIFLYQEQALTNKLDQPYRQRFLKISPDENYQQVESASFKLIQPKKYVGFCDQPESERVIKAEELGESNCSVFLQKQESGYLGKTPPEGCETNFRDAVKVTNTIILNEMGMDTLDRGFNAEGKQVWGAENRPYQFRRSSSQLNE